MLTLDNFENGFLVNDELIAGVTSMAGGIFAAYVSNYSTGETLAFAEFDLPLKALEYLGKLTYDWKYESVGCSTTKTSCSSGQCSGCKCAS